MSTAAPDPELPNTKEAVQVPTQLPPSTDMPGAGAKPVAVPFSMDPKVLATKSDEFIDRLTKLVRTTGGLGSLLSTLSYSLYIAAYLDVNSPTRQQIIAAISRLIGRTPNVAATALKATPASPPVSRLAPYIGLINDTRFAIRLTALLPMYQLLKSIIKSPPKDPILRLLARVQIVMYLSFTALENLWFLANKNLLSPTLTNRLGGTQKLLIWSCRPWLAAILCDYARLSREATLAAEKARNDRNRRSIKPLSEEQASQVAREQQIAEKKWYAELFAATSYLPMAVHYSLNSGIGMNLGLIGLSGALGGSATFTKLWAATKE